MDNHKSNNTTVSNHSTITNPEYCSGSARNTFSIFTETINDEVYIYLNGKLLHKKHINSPGSGVTFDVRAYRKGDVLKTIKTK